MSTQPSPTPEQSAIVAAAAADGPSIIMNAYAGCAKTTTLELIGNATKSTPTLALAFNVKIKKELEQRFPPGFEVKTLNGLGHAAWARSLGKSITLDERKLGKIVTELLRELDYDPSDREAWAEVLALASRAMQQGLVPSVFPNKSLSPDTPETWLSLADELWIDQDPAGKAQLAREALIRSIKAGFAGTISFDDQIYLSTMFNGVFKRYAQVLGDEAQDFSPLNHLMLRKSAAGRIILAGDRKQAIYAFRGADTSSMDNVKKLRTEWTELPLATTFRCPHAVVDRQQSHAPGFTAWHTNAQGQFLNWAIKPTEQQAAHPWQWSDVESELSAIGKPNATIAVLCRNTAPLLSLAFKLIRQGIGPTVAGRDIGKSLVKFATKLFPEDRTPVDLCRRKVTDWQSNETMRAQAAGAEHKLAAINDRAECLLAVAEDPSVTNAAELRASITHLFASGSGRIILSTGHRSKGLEWDLVLHLDPWRIPSKFARKAAAHGDDRQLQQEQNLLYVMETRSKHTLINASLEDFS